MMALFRGKNILGLIDTFWDTQTLMQVLLQLNEEVRKNLSASSVNRFKCDLYKFLPLKLDTCLSHSLVLELINSVLAHHLNIRSLVQPRSQPPEVCFQFQLEASPNYFLI